MDVCVISKKISPKTVIRLLSAILLTSAFISLFPLKTYAQDQFGAQAFGILAAENRGSQSVMKNVLNLKNSFQVDIIRALVSYKRLAGSQYDIDNKFPHLLEINSQYQVDAVKYIVEAGNFLDRAFPYIPQITNVYQSEAVKTISQAKNGTSNFYDMDYFFPDLLQVDNPHAVEALEVFARNKRALKDELKYIVQVKTSEQVLAVKLLVEGRTFNNQEYQVLEHIAQLMDLNKAVQLDALKALIDGGVGLKPSLKLLSQITTQEQVEAIKKFAKYKTLNTSISFAFLNPNALQMKFLERLLEAQVQADVFESFSKRLDSVTSQNQIDFLEEIIAHKITLPKNLHLIFKINNSHQVDYARFLLSKKISLDSSFYQILKIKNENQVTALEEKIEQNRFRVWAAKHINKKISPIKPNDYARVFKCTSWINDLDSEGE